MFHRKSVRDILWSDRSVSQVQDAIEQDSWTRIRMVCPALEDSLLGLTSQRRTKWKYLPACLDYSQISNLSPQESVLEKFTSMYQFYSAQSQMSTCFELEKQIRSAVLNKNEDHEANFFVEYNRCGPKLRALTIVNDDVNTEAVQATTRVLQQFGPQLRAFTFRGIDPFGMICQVKMMSRLKVLSIQTSALMKPLVEQIIPWAQLHSFTFMCPPNRRIFQYGPMFELLGHMTQLRELSFTVAYREKSTYRKYYTKDKHAQAKDQRLKIFLSEQIGKIPSFSMLEVFCLKVDSKNKHKFQSLVNYRLFLDLFAPKLGMKMKKLILLVPRLLHSTNNCISLDLVNGFPQLESLVLDYADNCRPKKTSKLICNLDRDDEHNQSQSIRRLTIKDIVHDCLLAIKQIPVIFPNLVELNIGGRGNYKEVYRNVTDHDFVEMINRLPHLRALRFIDDHCKFLYVLNSIELMCKRATELKPKVPMEFRVPLDQESKFMLWQTRRMSAYYCFEVAAQWIRIY